MASPGRRAVFMVLVGAVTLAAGLLSAWSAPGSAALGAVLGIRSTPVLEVTALDIGQGDAILLRTPSGDSILVDGGPDESVLDQLNRSMRPFDRNLAMAIVSHSDADHIGGLPAVLERYRVATLVSTGAPKDSAVRGEVDRLAAEQAASGLNVHHLFAGDLIELDPAHGVRAEVMWPPRSKVESTASDENDLSIVMRVSYGSSSVLLTGDVGEAVESELIRCQPQRIVADLLKVGHHGSDSSSTAGFLAAIAPSMAVISAGEGNRYGHPTDGVLARLASSTAAASVYITKNEGPVAFVLDGLSVSRKEP